jgi:hypothetical protein
MQSWLEHYAYRIRPGVMLFVFTGGLLIATVLGTIVYHTIRSTL